MWSSKFFWKFLLASAGLNSLILILFSSLLIGYSDRLLVEQSNNRLESAIAFLGLELQKEIETQAPLASVKPENVFGQAETPQIALSPGWDVRSREYAKIRDALPECEIVWNR